LCVAILLMLFVLLDMLLDRTVVQLLGGEPRAAVNYMASIATGDLAINIETSASRADSLMATLKIMQLKLKNMIVAVQGAAGEVTAQKADFEVAAAVYQHRRDESSAQELLRRIQAVSKTLALLEKAIGRFKL
jgi:methyl-accepting chemotaxis protein